jgi:cation diffusion facilitator CzcD-associated flavoprotein CzcO
LFGKRLNRQHGDKWRNRYKSLCLHDPVLYDHLPSIKVPENWPVLAQVGGRDRIEQPRARHLRGALGK